MGLTRIPLERDYELGRDKLQQGPVKDLDFAITAQEHNIAKKAIGGTARAVGLADGTTEESLEMAKRSVNDPGGARPNDFVCIDDFTNLVNWEDISSGGGAVSIADGNNTVSQVEGASLLRLAGSTIDAIAGIDQSRPYINGSHNPVITAKIRTNADLSISQLSIGLADDYPVNTSTSWALISYSTNGWAFATKSADGGDSEIDSSIGTIEENTWYVVKIEFNSSNDEVKFYVDGEVIGTVTNSDAIPNEQDNLSPFIALDFGDNGAQEAYVDYFDLRVTRL